MPIAIAEGPEKEAKFTDAPFFPSEEKMESGVSLFPNPASTHINIKFEQPTAETTHLFIFNQLGQRSGTFMIPKGIEQEVLDVQGFTAGGIF